jgi:hypothetical protein
VKNERRDQAAKERICIFLLAEVCGFEERQSLRDGDRRQQVNGRSLTEKKDKREKNGKS